MSHDKFIHHECYSTADADEQTRKGFFDVIEDEYGPYVFSSYEGMILMRFDTMAEADTYARKLAGMGPDWYLRRDELQCEQIFRMHDGSFVKLDHRKPGDGSKWVVADWSGRIAEWDNGWSYDESSIEPHDLDKRLPDDWDKLQPVEPRK